MRSCWEELPGQRPTFAEITSKRPLQLDNPTLYDDVAPDEDEMITNLDFSVREIMNSHESLVSSILNLLPHVKTGTLTGSELETVHPTAMEDCYTDMKPLSRSISEVAARNNGRGGHHYGNQASLHTKPSHNGELKRAGTTSRDHSLVQSHSTQYISAPVSRNNSNSSDYFPMFTAERAM
jgi:hypothetical protein